MTKWATPSAWTAVTIALDSLANGSSTTSGTVIANGASLDLYIDVSLILGSFTPTAAPYIELHWLGLLANGTTYADVSMATLVNALPVTTTTGVKALMFGNPRSPIFIPPGSGKLAVINRANASFAATGNTMFYRTYSIA